MKDTGQLWLASNPPHSLQHTYPFPSAHALPAGSPFCPAETHPFLVYCTSFHLELPVNLNSHHDILRCGFNFVFVSGQLTYIFDMGTQFFHHPSAWKICSSPHPLFLLLASSGLTSLFFSLNYLRHMSGFLPHFQFPAFFLQLLSSLLTIDKDDSHCFVNFE